MSDRPIDLSVVLVNWNSLALTDACLTSIREQTHGIRYEVFVVDNGTTKDDGPAVLPVRHPWIELIRNDANLGFTKANNQGIRRASGRYVLLLNNDTVQTENALGRAVAYMDEHADVGALGILHRNADAGRTPQASYFEYPRPWTEIAGLLGLVRAADPSIWLPDVRGPRDTDWVCGSFLMMRRSCLEQVGELDERFFIYQEDVDWCLRARRAGWLVRFWPGVSMVHVGSAAKPFMKDKTLVMFRSQVSYYRKQHGLAAAAAYFAAMGLRMTGASLKQLVLLLAGRASLADLGLRVRRQAQFLSLRPGRVGG
jgi:GT2 family glycosyltransferase